MENLAVGAIVVLAVYYFVRGLYRSFKPDEQGSCGCSCNSSCSQTTACDELSKDGTES